MVDGEKMRRLREAADITQTELATAAGISCQLMSFIESGLRDPSVRAFKRMADRLGVTMDSLMKAN